MTADIHTCSYYCERPGCIRAQRDELRDRLEAALAPQPAAPSVAAASAEPVLWYRTLFGAETKPDGRCYDVVFCDPHDSRYTPLYAAPQQSAAVDEAKETDLWRCTVCGRVGTVGRCCGEETREPLAPPSAPVGVNFAAVASILRRAMRDGVHYGYRRDFILQQALALEALSQQPAAVDAGLAQRIHALVGGVEVDLKAPLREQEEGHD